MFTAWFIPIFSYQYLPEIGIRQRDYAIPFHPHFFLLHELAPRKAQGISIGCNDTLLKEHGSLTHELLHTIAPQASFLFVEAAGHLEAYAHQLSLLTLHSVDVLLVNVACKEPLDYTHPAIELIESCLKKHKWVIGAAGNNQNSWHTNGCAYPACSSNVTYSVGSYDSKKMIFSQSAIMNMPCLVAPGQLSTRNSIHGTSLSSALVAGFIALVAGEFQSFFTKQQLKIIINYALFKHDETWQEAVRGGYIDFRMALYMMHILRAIYYHKEVPRQPILINHCMLLRSFLLKESYHWFSDFCSLYPCERLLQQPEKYHKHLIEQDTISFISFLDQL